MTTAVAKTRTDEMLTRLNDLRMMPVSKQQKGIDQAIFTMRGLKKSDPSAAIAFEGIISALQNNRDGLDSAAKNLVSNYPSEYEDLLNIFKTYAMIDEVDSAENIITFLKENTPSAQVLADTGIHLLALGAWDTVDEMISLDMPNEPAQINNLNDIDKIMLQRILDFRMRSHESNLEGSEVAKLVVKCKEIAAKFDRNLVPVVLEPAPNGVSEFGQSAVVSVHLKGSGEEALELEDALLSDSFLMNHPYIDAGHLTIQVDLV